MRKYLPMLMLLLSGIGYISITQIFLKNKHFDFSEVYVADEFVIEFTDDSKGLMVAKEQYQEDDKFYIEIVETDEIKVTLIGEEVYIDGIRAESGATVFVKGTSILLESKTAILVAPKNVRYEKVNEEQAISKVKIGIGSALAVAIALLITAKTLPPKLKVSLTLAVTTVVVFMLAQILHEMFWTLVWANIGWYSGMGLSAIRTKDQKKLQKVAEEVVRRYGNV